MSGEDREEKGEGRGVGVFKRHQKFYKSIFLQNNNKQTKPPYLRKKKGLFCNMFPGYVFCLVVTGRQKLYPLSANEGEGGVK